MKKLLIAICLLLVFGITSAAISFGRASFDSAGSGGSSGGSADVALDTRVVRGSSSDGGSFAMPQGGGGAASYMLSGGYGRGDGASLTTRTGDNGFGGQGNELSFEGWLQRYAEPFSRAYGPGANGDSGGDSSRQAYSPASPVARLESLGAAGGGGSGGNAIARLASLVPDAEPVADPVVPGGDTITTPVPEPETYAMLLAGLCLVGVVARRRKAGAS